MNEIMMKEITERSLRMISNKSISPIEHTGTVGNNTLMINIDGVNVAYQGLAYNMSTGDYDYKNLPVK